MIVNCAQCETPKNVTPRRVKPRNFCSKKCSGIYKRKLVSINCKLCGSTSLKHSYVIKKYGTDLFCSKNCQNVFQVGINNPKYVYVNKKCQICNKDIPHERALKKETKCCSKECKIQSFSGKNHYLWKGGVSFISYPKEFTKNLKNNIKNRDNFECQCCGKSQKEENLAIHHIDSNKFNCSEENLITTCQKCNNAAKKMQDYWVNFYKYNLFKRGLGSYEWRVQKSQAYL